MKYRSLRPWKYQVLEDYSLTTNIAPGRDIITEYISHTVDGTITAHKGYCWDGATWAVDSSNFMRGSLVHDMFCQLIEDKLLHSAYRSKADELLHKMITEDGMSQLRAWWILRAVKAYVNIKYDKGMG